MPVPIWEPLPSARAPGHPSCFWAGYAGCCHQNPRAKTATLLSGLGHSGRECLLPITPCIGCYQSNTGLLFEVLRGLGEDGSPGCGWVFWFLFTVLSLFQDSGLSPWKSGPGANVTDPDIPGVTTLLQQLRFVTVGWSHRPPLPSVPQAGSHDSEF